MGYFIKHLGGDTLLKWNPNLTRSYMDTEDEDWLALQDLNVWLGDDQTDEEKIVHIKDILDSSTNGVLRKGDILVLRTLTQEESLVMSTLKVLYKRDHIGDASLRLIAHKVEDADCRYLYDSMSWMHGNEENKSVARLLLDNEIQDLDEDGTFSLIVQGYGSIVYNEVRFKVDMTVLSKVKLLFG